MAVYSVPSAGVVPKKRQNCLREQIDKRGKQHADGKPRLQDAVEAICCLRGLSLRQKPGIARAAAQPQTMYKGKEHRMQRQTKAERQPYW